MSPRLRAPSKLVERRMVKTTLLMFEDRWRHAKMRTMEAPWDLRDLLLDGPELVVKLKESK